MPTYVHLRTISLGIARRPATHNPLVHGSSPCGPTTFESRALRGFCVSGWFSQILVSFCALPYRGLPGPIQVQARLGNFQFGRMKWQV